MTIIIVVKRFEEYKFIPSALIMSTESGMTAEELEFLRKTRPKPTKAADVLIDVHGNAHEVRHKRTGEPVKSHVPGATNYITSSDQVNHRFETSNEQYFGHEGKRSRSNSPGRVPIHRRAASPARSGSRGGSREGSRSGSPAGARRASSPSIPPSKAAEEMVAKMLEESIGRHKWFVRFFVASERMLCVCGYVITIKAAGLTAFFIQKLLVLLLFLLLASWNKWW